MSTFYRNLVIESRHSIKFSFQCNIRVYIQVPPSREIANPASERVSDALNVQFGRKRSALTCFRNAQQLTNRLRVSKKKEGRAECEAALDSNAKAAPDDEHVPYASIAGPPTLRPALGPRTTPSLDGSEAEDESGND